MNWSQSQKFGKLSTNGDISSTTSEEVQKIAFQALTSKISSGNGSTSTSTTAATATTTTTATRGRNSFESIKPSETNVIDDDLANVTTTTTATIATTTTTATKERKNDEEKFKRQRNFVSSENELRTTSTTTNNNNINNNREEEKGSTTTTTEEIEIIGRQTLLPAKVDGKKADGDLTSSIVAPPMPINSTRKKWQASQSFRYKMQELLRRRQQQQQREQQQQQQLSQPPSPQQQQRINLGVMEKDQRPAETSKIHFLTILNFTKFF